MCEYCGRTGYHSCFCPLADEDHLKRCLICGTEYDEEDLFHGICNDCMKHAPLEEYISYATTQEPEAFVSWYWGIEIKRADEKERLIQILLKEMGRDMYFGELARDFCLDIPSYDNFARWMEEKHK